MPDSFDRSARVPRFPRAVVAALGVTLLLAGCQETSHQTEPPVVKVPTPERVIIELSKVFEEGSQVGWLRVYQYRDGRGTVVTRVYDMRNNDLGYISNDGRAFRLTAHGGPDLVANHEDVARNVAAIFGRPLSRMRVETVESVRR